jgi:PIN domain nuclease of toxin-antitoxin system
MTDAETVFVSAVTIWEIAIKHALGRSGRNRMPFSGGEAIAEFTAAGFEFLNITPEHAAAVGELRGLHGDPFDRLLVAQAMSEPLILLTHDRAVAAYGDTIVLV